MSLSASEVDELEKLEDKAMDAAQDLAKALQALSDYHWKDEGINPVIRPVRGTMDLVKDIVATVMKPVKEIEAAL